LRGPTSKGREGEDGQGREKGEGGRGGEGKERRKGGDKSPTWLPQNLGSTDFTR